MADFFYGSTVYRSWKNGAIEYALGKENAPNRVNGALTCAPEKKKDTPCKYQVRWFLRKSGKVCLSVIKLFG